MNSKIISQIIPLAKKNTNTAALNGTWTHDHQLSGPMLYKLRYWSSIASNAIFVFLNPTFPTHWGYSTFLTTTYRIFISICSLCGHTLSISSKNFLWVELHRNSIHSPESQICSVSSFYAWITAYANAQLCGHFVWASYRRTNFLWNSTQYTMFKLTLNWCKRSGYTLHINL